MSISELLQLFESVNILSGNQCLKLVLGKFFDRRKACKISIWENIYQRGLLFGECLSGKGAFHLRKYSRSSVFPAEGVCRKYYHDTVSVCISVYVSGESTFPRAIC